MPQFARFIAPWAVVLGVLVTPAAYAAPAVPAHDVSAASGAAELWRQGHDAVEHGALVEAVRYFKASLNVDPRGHDALVDLATTLSDLERWDDARSAYERAVHAFPDDATALNGLGYVHYRQERFDVAIGYFEQALSRMDDPQFHLNLGLALLSQERYGQAEAQFKRTLELDADHYWATNNLGWVYQLEGRDEDAMAAYSQALKLKPPGITTHMNLGRLLLDQEAFEDAGWVFEDALKKDDASSEAHMGLAVSYENLGKLQEARREVMVALRLQPNYANAHAAFARLLEATGEPERAYAEMKEAIRQAPTDADHRLWLARTYEKHERYDEAIAAYEAYMAIAEDDPERPDAAMHLRLLSER